MDFRKLARAMPGPVGDNSTGLPNINDAAPDILSALIPGYSIISRYISAYLGIDISIFVTIGILCVAGSKVGQYLYYQLLALFSVTFMSSVYIDEHDDLFDMAMGWLAAHQTAASRNRKMRAKTQRGAKVEDEYETAGDDALNSKGMFDFRLWSARTPPRYEPYYGKSYIWHNGNIFWFNLSKKEGQRIQVSFNSQAEDDILQLDCIGRSIAPIKDLLRTIRVWSLTGTSGTTTIRHPTPKDRARFGGTWSKTSFRPSRPMDTVILDAEQKSMIVQDMNEYLHPASPKWYATRGIPYRRGYLFHGPPGTGKTSLSFALAGIFGLEIYAISLQEPTLTEGDLIQLFNALPRRCIVLLEDIDAAGLVRDASEDADTDGKNKKEGKGRPSRGVNGVNGGTKDEKSNASGVAKKDDDFTLKDLAKALTALGNQGPAGRGGRGGRPNTDGQAAATISLSGLLNAIDGVATHEGRILIMTTNHPEKLDAALIRPGRVDRKVEFRLAMKEQIRELFTRMYAASEEASESSLAIGGGAAADSGEKKSALMNGNAGSSSEDQLSSLSRSGLEELAAEFAAQVPDGTFTPAEVQNLLMRYKTEPRTALEKVHDWMKETIDEKEALSGGKDENEQDATKGVNDDTK